MKAKKKKKMTNSKKSYYKMFKKKKLLIFQRKLNLLSKLKTGKLEYLIMMIAVKVILALFTFYIVIIRQALKKMAQFDEVLRMDNWKEYVNDKKEGVIIETRVNSKGYNCVKAYGFHDYPIDDVFKLINEGAQYRVMYDKTFDRS